MKKGKFAIYKGKEYGFSKDMEGNMLILTRDKTFIDETFSDRYGTGIYSKIVTADQLQEAYAIVNRGIIEGYNVDILKEKEDSFLVGTSDCTVGKTLNLERVDKYGYEGWIEKDKIIIVQEKKELI